MSAPPPAWNSDGARRYRAGANAKTAGYSEHARQFPEDDSLLENAVEGLHRVGPDGRVIWANTAQLRLLGYSFGEYVGRHLKTIFTDPDTFEQFWRKLMRGEIVYDFPALMRCKDGSSKNVRINSGGFWENGRFVHTRCFIRDVTERVQLENELKQRIADLAEAERQKNEFLAMLGHELRNPLSAVLNAITSARRKPSNREAALDIALRQTRQLAALVDDLLDIGRITQGRISLRKEPLRLGSSVEKAVHDARFLLQSRKHQMRLAIEEDAVVEVDPGRLCQIIQNLIDNAAKYTPAGGKIEIIVRRSAHDAIVCVRDNGMGIAQEMLPRIFDLFTQAERPLSRSYGGLGIGLALVKRLTEMHGGHVFARSDGVGRGAEFEFRLPACHPGASQNGDSPAASDRQNASGLRILLVEDNADACESLAMLLEDFGHQVKAAADGHQAIQTVTAGTFDVLLVDIGLPGLDGYEVARRIREMPNTGHLIMAALTGYGQEEDRRRALSAGFNYHLTKPVDMDRLNTILAAATH